MYYAAKKIVLLANEHYIKNLRDRNNHRIYEESALTYRFAKTSQGILLKSRSYPETRQYLTYFRLVAIATYEEKQNKNVTV
jgi:hypothetical protein